MTQHRCVTSKLKDAAVLCCGHSDMVYDQEDQGHFGGAVEQTEALMMELERPFGGEMCKPGGSASLNRHSNMNLSVLNDKSALITSSNCEFSPLLKGTWAVL